ncbi:hypothetical protein SeMB42_g07114 [Synchytrium endobioticum]|uniref:Uncharacterized protein n=1 Tax=Synchytrium endobioticum TaxID=286115 RepID=A0A507C3G3_9FUNG|nr:hypothetical protein SeMB42_g07114 [Synchytrium endobioticum]
MSLPKIQLETQSNVEHLRHQLKQAATVSLQTRAAEIIYRKYNNTDTSNRAKQQNVRSSTQAVVAGLEQYLDQVFGLASHNLQINGVDYHDAITQAQEYEPLDETLSAQIEQARLAKDQLMVKVALMRREFPKKIQALVHTAETRCSRARGADAVVGPAPHPRIHPLQHAVDAVDAGALVHDYAGCVGTIAALAQPAGVPATTSKLERASQLLAIWELTFHVPDPNAIIDVARWL